MSHVAHVLSALAITQYLDVGILFWMILGQIAPDLFKGIIYTDVGGDERPTWQKHKMLPLGITHVPLFHVGVSLVIFFFHPYSIWPAVSYLIGAVLHSIMDLGDHYGILFFWPFYRNPVSIKQSLGKL